MLHLADQLTDLVAVADVARLDRERAQAFEGSPGLEELVLVPGREDHAVPASEQLPRDEEPESAGPTEHERDGTVGGRGRAVDRRLGRRHGRLRVVVIT
ncbi:hypothetical protein GCM10009817_28780 [Terrabacter lapilli]|uniref:Uncharacterized protein n=1 Tax=Terrabacter lapilli TaxID=436231 RepID=A0ABN2SF76_9MICO